jgi:heptosyltransferase II
MKPPNILDKITVLEDVISTNLCPAIQFDGSVRNLGQISFKQFFRNLFIWFYTFPSFHRGALPENPKCVIVCTGSNLGGAIISLPLVQSVRKRWPNSHMAVLSNSSHGIEVMKHAGLGDSFHLMPNGSLKDLYFRRDLKEIMKTLKVLAAEVLITNHDFHLDYLLMPLRIPHRIGSINFSVSGKALVWGGMYNFKVNCREGQNWLESYSDISKIFQDNPLTFPSLAVSEVQKREARQILLKLGLPLEKGAIAIQASVWAQQKFKQWPIHLLAEAIKEITAQSNLVPVIFGTKGQEQSLIELKKIIPEISLIDIIGRTTISEALTIISQCEVSIVNDSGLMHLSAAIGTPTVAIYGMTDPSVTWSYGANHKHRIVRRNDCLPCYGLGESILINCTNRVCLSEIYPQTVVKAVVSLIKKS